MVEALCKSRTKEIFWTKMLLLVKKLCRQDLNLFRLRLMTEVYQLFYQAVRPCFTNFNKLLQREEPLIHKLCDSQQRFMSKLASRFINPSVIQNHKDLGNSFSTLSSDRQNDIEAILQIFNRTHKTFVQGPYILNVVEEFFRLPGLFKPRYPREHLGIS